jgi:hypothetical protein
MRPRDSHRFRGLLAYAALATGSLTGAEPVSLSYLYSSPSSGPYEGRAEQHQWRFQALLPAYASAEQSPIILVNPSGQYDRLLIDDGATADLELYKLKLGVTGIWKVGAHALALSATPGVHSDLEHLDEDDLRLEASAVWTVSASERLDWLLGFAYEDQFGRPGLFPIGGLRWKPAEGWEVDLLFPAPRLRYQPLARLAVFIAGEPVGSTWNVSRRDQPAIDIRQSGYRLGAGVEGSPWSGLWLAVFAGREVNRSYDISERHGADIQTWDVEDQDFIRVSISWR